MEAFAELLERLVYTRSRNAKLKLIADYLTETPDPDRGWALAALAGGLDLPSITPSAIRDLVAGRVDPALFRLSYDYVGDLAETVALIWPAEDVRANAPLDLDSVVGELRAASRAKAAVLVEAWLDRLDASGRYALLKLATGGLRVGVSARLAKTAFARAFDVEVDQVEEYWHALRAPYAELFAWGEGRAEAPELADLPVFRPFMLAHPLDGEEVDPAEFVVEWKWDGIRVQLVRAGDETRLYSRAGDDISGAFPDVVSALHKEGALDGELLVRGADGAVAPFNHLQQRLNRKSVSKAMLERFPAFVRCYDLMFDGGEDIRGAELTARRARLRDFLTALPEARFDFSEALEARDMAAIEELRQSARDEAMEGLMLKRADSAYVAGRRKGLWYKWKRDPLAADVVLMYAQRGHGKRSSYFSDYTFGAWQGEKLLPVGKAYFGFTDDELKALDGWVRRNTVARYGPVREVEKKLVLEVAFDSIHTSKRHKSGVAMRFPRIKRIRWDKPAEEADMLETLTAMVG